jgi:hypothetical protein
VILLFVLPCIAGMTGMCHHVQSLVEMGSLTVFAQAGLKPRPAQFQSPK